MTRFAPLVALFAAAAPAQDVKRDLPYADPAHERQVLDVYAPKDAKNLPVVVWVHGGGWQTGDKAGVQLKPQAFAEKGFVFVAMNYRLLPSVDMGTIVRDVAKAVGWVRTHAAEHGGDPDRLFVMGHSAGAQLAALLCTDDRYLKAEGVPLSAIKGCVPVDVSAYDIPKLLTNPGSVPSATYVGVFGADEGVQRDLSPVTHAAAGKGVPPFLLLHVAGRVDTESQSKAFAEKLKAAGVAATVVAGEGKTHGSINADLGLPDDPPTMEVYSFLDRVLKK